MLTLDLEKHLGPDLEEALFVAVEFMYFKEMMDVPSEMLFKVRVRTSSLKLYDFLSFQYSDNFEIPPHCHNIRLSHYKILKIT